jgi:predicted acyl esterase
MKFTTLLISLCIASTLLAQKYREISIPTRVSDTTKKYLLADVYANDSTTAKAVILIQTPYNKSLYRLSLGNASSTSGAGVPYDSSKYNYVIVDWRGFYANTDAGITPYNRGLDGFDIIEWIATQKWCNGRVGTWGGSALGQIQFQTAAQHPPHLICAAPFIKDFKTKYEDFYYGGDYRKEHAQSLVKLGFTTEQLILSHPSKDVYWTVAENQSDMAKDISIPMFLCSGWFDHFPNDVLRAFSDLQTKSNASVRSKHKMLFGPWQHMSIGSPAQGDLTYQDAESLPTNLGLQFFNYYLREEENAWEAMPTVRYYQMGENRWKTCDEWSKVATVIQSLYFHEDNSLQFTAPPPVRKLVTPDSIIADPRKPVPTIGGSRFNPFDRTIKTGPINVSELLLNTDVIKYQTDTLQQDIVMNGALNLKLFITPTTKDADISARLCDVYPDGRWIILTQGVLRLRYRKSLSTPELLNVNELQEVNIHLNDIAQTFIKGHKIGIILSGSNYPMFDVNLNDGGTLYKAGDTTIATTFLFRDYSSPSRLEFGTNAPISRIEDDSLKATDSLAVYPNPAANSISVRYYGANKGLSIIEIFNDKGDKVLEQKTAKNETTVDVTALAIGTYTLRMNSRTTRVVIQR